MPGKYDDYIIKLTGKPLRARQGTIRETLGKIAQKYDGRTVAEFYAATRRDRRINLPANTKTIDRLVDQGFITLIR